MTGAWFLIGFAIGLTSVTIGYRIRRTVTQRQLEAQIPRWVNQGNQRPVVISLAQLENEINFALWEHELEQGVDD